MIKTLDDVHILANWIEVKISTTRYSNKSLVNEGNMEYRVRAKLHLLM